MRKLPRLRSKLFILAALLAGAGAARATNRLPLAIEDDLSLSYQVQCNLCHINGKTGAGTAITPFAINAKLRGMDSRDRVKLATALASMERDQVDSDGDGIGDIAELRAGTDPNAPGKGIAIDPSYGCSVAVGAGGASGGAALLPLGVLLLLVRRRRPIREACPRAPGLPAPGPPRAQPAGHGAARSAPPPS